MTASEYQKAMEKIHATEDLKKAAIEKMKEQRKGKRRPAWVQYVSIAAAACLLLFAGVYYVLVQDHGIYVEQVTELEKHTESIGVHTGRVGEETKEKDIFTAETYQNREFIPDDLWEIKASEINGQEIHICFEKDTETFYAAAETDGAYELFCGEKTDEKTFVKYLKDNFK